MSGIESGGFDYDTLFRNYDATDVNDLIQAGYDQAALYNAAVNAINQTALRFQNTRDQEDVNKFLELADKFEKVFPGANEEIKNIHDFVQEFLGIELSVPDAMHMFDIDAETSMALEKFNNLPIMTHEDTTEKLKNEPLGTLLLRRSSDATTRDHLVIAIKTDEGFPPGFGVEQFKFPPGHEVGRYLDIFTNTEHSMEELVEKYSLQYMPLPQTPEEYKMTINEAQTGKGIAHLIDRGADPDQFLNAAVEIVKEALLDPALDKAQLKEKLVPLFEKIHQADRSYSGSDSLDTLTVIIASRDVLSDLLANKVVSVGKLSDLITHFFFTKNIPIASFVHEAISQGLQSQLKMATENLAAKIKYFTEGYHTEPISFTNLPELSATETIAQLKDKPIGTILARKSADWTTRNQLVIGINTDKGIQQMKIPPGEEVGNFSLDGKDYTIAEIMDIIWLRVGPSNLNSTEITEDYEELLHVAALANFPIPAAIQKDFENKILIPDLAQNASSAMKKALYGKVSELSLEEMACLPAEVSKLGLLLPESVKILALADAVFAYVKSHQNDIQKNPEIATRAHQILHNLAQVEIVRGNFKIGFNVEGKAAEAIPLSATNPLHEMDKAILDGTAKQLNPLSGAHFSSLDTSILKGGNLHASQRTIDGIKLNCFDFKISHYARDELRNYIYALTTHLKDFKASLPKDFCTDVKLREVPQEYFRFDELKGEYTRSGGYSPGFSQATEIVFEGAGKIVIGNDENNGCMYNWIQIEMDADLPAGEGVKKLHQMLAVIGLGPVLGKQPPEADERLKIAQLFRAFYPSKATRMDTTAEFYQLSIDDLKKTIIAREPGMSDIFKKYLETSPDLMVRVEIIPGKEIWGIKDLGEQMKANGAIGLMTGIGNSGGWDSAKFAIERVLTLGAMSSEDRFKSGVFKRGSSSEEDLVSGGGDQVFTRMINHLVLNHNIGSFPFHGRAQILWDLDKVVQRVPYGYEEDKFGVKNRFMTIGIDKSYADYEFRDSLIKLAGGIVRAENEIMVKNFIDPSHIVGVVVESQTFKDDLIQHLISKGIAEKDAKGDILVKFSGKKIKANDFFHVADTGTFKKEWWG